MKPMFLIFIATLFVYVTAVPEQPADCNTVPFLQYYKKLDDAILNKTKFFVTKVTPMQWPQNIPKLNPPLNICSAFTLLEELKCKNILITLHHDQVTSKGKKITTNAESETLKNAVVLERYTKRINNDFFIYEGEIDTIEINNPHASLSGTNIPEIVHTQQNLKFGLYDCDPDRYWNIYKSCDGKLFWLQVETSKMNNFSSLELQVIDNAVKQAANMMDNDVNNDLHYVDVLHPNVV